jgi:peptidoglycan hydrolase-like protein with peptidoglycan-binding domain
MRNSNLVSLEVPSYKGNYTVGRSGRKIEAITIHHMAGILSAKRCGEIFQRVGRYGSSHYGIGFNGEIAQYVDEANTAWTNSNWDSNCKSITIETSNSTLAPSWLVSDNVLNILIKLVADIAKRNNIKLVKGKTLTWHSMFNNTQCPGNYLLGKFDYIIAEANKLNNPKPAVNFLGTKGYLGFGDKGTNVEKICAFMRKTFPTYSPASILGNYYGPILTKSIKDLQKRTKIKVDGYVGPIT